MILGDQRGKIRDVALQPGARKGNCVYAFHCSMLQGKEGGMEGWDEFCYGGEQR